MQQLQNSIFILRNVWFFIFGTLATYLHCFCTWHLNRKTHSWRTKLKLFNLSVWIFLPQFWLFGFLPFPNFFGFAAHVAECFSSLDTRAVSPLLLSNIKCHSDEKGEKKQIAQQTYWHITTVTTKLGRTICDFWCNISMPLCLMPSFKNGPLAFGSPAQDFCPHCKMVKSCEGSTEVVVSLWPNNPVHINAASKSHFICRPKKMSHWTDERVWKLFNWKTAQFPVCSQSDFIWLQQKRGET